MSYASKLDRVLRLIGGFVLVAVALIISCGQGKAANACSSSDAPPDCQQQIQASVSYSWLESNTWAYYCTGDHPYYWGPSNSSDTGNFQVLTPNFTFVESIFAENGSPSKMDAEFTNWSFYGQNLVVALACSDQPPPQVQVCKNPGVPDADPGCLQSDAHQYCGGRVPVCFTIYQEKCSNGQTYQCTNELGLAIWCQACGSSTNAHAQSHVGRIGEQSADEKAIRAVRFVLGLDR